MTKKIVKNKAEKKMNMILKRKNLQVCHPTAPRKVTKRAKKTENLKRKIVIHTRTLFQIPKTVIRLKNLLLASECPK